MKRTLRDTLDKIREYSDLRPSGKARLSAEEINFLETSIETPEGKRGDACARVIELMEQWGRTDKAPDKQVLLSMIADLAGQEPSATGSQPLRVPLPDSQASMHSFLDNDDADDPDDTTEDGCTTYPAEDDRRNLSGQEAACTPRKWRTILDSSPAPVEGKISIVGDRAHGKSWYVWALNELLMQHRCAGWTISQRGETFSDLLDEMNAAIKEQRAVRPTDMLRAATEYELFQAERHGTKYSIRMCDPAGEHLGFAFRRSSEEVKRYAFDQYRPEEAQTFIEALNRFIESICTSEALLLLVDVEILLRHNVAWKREWMHAVSNLFDLLAERDARSGQSDGHAIVTPIALVFTKLDKVVTEQDSSWDRETSTALWHLLEQDEGAEDVTPPATDMRGDHLCALLREKWPEMHAYLDARVRQYSLFVVSAWGYSDRVPQATPSQSAYKIPPPEASPLFVEEPLIWLLDELWIKNCVTTTLDTPPPPLFEALRGSEVLRALRLLQTRRFPARYVPSWGKVSAAERQRMMKELDVRSPQVWQKAGREMRSGLARRARRLAPAVLLVVLVGLLLIEALFWSTYAYVESGLRVEHATSEPRAQRLLMWQPAVRWVPWKWERNAALALAQREAVSICAAAFHNLFNTPFPEARERAASIYALGPDARAGKFDLLAIAQTPGALPRDRTVAAINQLLHHVFSHGEPDVAADWAAYLVKVSIVLSDRLTDRDAFFFLEELHASLSAHSRLPARHELLRQALARTERSMRSRWLFTGAPPRQGELEDLVREFAEAEAASVHLPVGAAGTPWAALRQELMIALRSLADRSPTNAYLVLRATEKAFAPLLEQFGVRPSGVSHFKGLLALPDSEFAAQLLLSGGEAYMLGGHHLWAITCWAHPLLVNDTKASARIQWLRRHQLELEQSREREPSLDCDDALRSIRVYREELHSRAVELFSPESFAVLYRESWEQELALLSCLLQRSWASIVHEADRDQRMKAVLRLRRVASSAILAANSRVELGDALGVIEDTYQSLIDRFSGTAAERMFRNDWAWLQQYAMRWRERG